MTYNDFCLNGPATLHVLSASDTESNNESAKPSLVAKTYWPEEGKINDTLSSQQAHKAVSAKYCPTIVSSRDIDCLTKSIHEDLGPQPATKANSRMLRVLTTFPLKKMHFSNPTTRSAKMVFKGWKEWFESHYTLWKKGIEHNDISLDNLMLDPILGVGVLHDFDLVKIVDWKVRGERQIGTVSFAAFDLLTEETKKHRPIRLYRHDVESLIWVLVWVCLLIDRNGEMPKGMDQRKMSRQSYRFHTWMDPSVPEFARSEFLEHYLTDYQASPRFEKLWILAMCFLEWLNNNSRGKSNNAMRVLLRMAKGEPSEDHVYQEIANLIKSFEASPVFASLT